MRKPLLILTVFILLCGVGVLTKPDEPSFRRFVRQRDGLVSALGYGMLTAKRVDDWVVFRIGHASQGRQFVGIFNTWLPLPLDYLSGKEGLTPLFAVLNCVVYGLWLIAGRSSNFMRTNFTASPKFTLERLHLWSLVTASFSHFEFMHLFNSLVTLNTFGPAVEKQLGGVNFAFFFLGAAVFPNLLTVLVKRATDSPLVEGYGAGGPIMALVGYTVYAGFVKQAEQQYNVFGMTMGPVGRGLVFFVLDLMRWTSGYDFIVNVVGFGFGVNYCYNFQ
eukprot:TRINITY_DN30270_c0_g1_i1.p2 TRINITY_DN30270_c0_g1~~TRINITY_DN30270_c0_g1_i1.p2  ORF type:complete len:290 (+),score=44.34 TRINITY_DN30270_c0_g1_i1:44-871(+)